MRLLYNSFQTVFRLFQKRDNVNNSTRPRGLSWQPRDLLLVVLLIVAVLSLLNTTKGGIPGFISATDKPTAVYGDFCDYYYPAGRTILRQPEPLGGYFYTPSFALMLTFFAPDSFAEALLRWQVLQHLGTLLLLIIPGLFLATRGQKKIWLYLYILVFLVSFAPWHNLKWGQMSVSITFLSIATLMLHERGRQWAAALTLTFATLIKYYPAALVFYYLIRRDFAFIARFTFCMLIAGLIFPAAFLGLDKTIEFYRLLNEEMAYALDWVAFDLNSQFLPHVIIRLMGLEADAATRGILSLLSSGICLAAFFKMYKLHNAGKCDPVLTSSAVFLMFPLLINTSWPHYFVYMPFCAILMLQNASSKTQRQIILLAILLQSCLVYILTDYQFYSGSGMLLAANMLLLATWFAAQKTPPVSDLAGQNPEVS